MCSFVIVVVFMYLFRVTYVWTCGCAWLLDQESRDARPFADSRACVRVSARVCVRTIVDCGAYGFVRVFVLCRVPSVRASRVTGAVGVARCMNSPASRARGRRALM